MKHYVSFVKERAARLSAVVLAGGKSTRWGQDKADMEFDGERVIDTLVDRLRPFQFQRLVLVRAQGKGGAVPDQVDALVDDREGLGPIGGILTALNHLPGDVLVTACDMPFISESLIEWLLGQYDGVSDAIIPCHQGGVEPLLGIYTKSVIPVMENAIQSKRFALHHLLQEISVRFLPIPSRFEIGREFANVNTPEDYKRIVAMNVGMK